jgi:hypothetical protein
MLTSPSLSAVRLSVSNKTTNSGAIGMPLPTSRATRVHEVGFFDGHRQTAHRSVHACRYSFRIVYTQRSIGQQSPVNANNEVGLTMAPTKKHARSGDRRQHRVD